MFSLIKAKKKVLIVTDILIRELEINYSIEQIRGMMKPFEKQIEKIIITTEQRDEAKKIAEQRNVPPADVLHAIIARDNKLSLITRDNHFRKLEDISKHYKPEDLI